MKNHSSQVRRTMRSEGRTDRWVDRLVRVGAPLMLALSSLSILAVMLLVHKVPPSMLVPMGGLAAAVGFYLWGERRRDEAID